MVRLLSVCWQVCQAPQRRSHGADFYIRRRILQQRSDPRPVGPSRQAFLADPAGNLVELHQVMGVHDT
jgi:hypothetical protein